MRIDGSAIAIALMTLIACSSAPDVAPRMTVERGERLADSAPDYEPAIAAGPSSMVYVTAGRDLTGGKKGDQRLVIWRSSDGGTSFQPPSVVIDDGKWYADERILADDSGVVYLSYMDATMAGQSRLRLAVSRDRGRTFVAGSLDDPLAADKPELAISRGGRDIYVAYAAMRQLSVMASHDGGATWLPPVMVAPGNGGQFWPTAMALSRGGTLLLSTLSGDASTLRDPISTNTLDFFRSSDEGRTWSHRSFGDSPRTLNQCPHGRKCRVKINIISIASDGGNRVYALYTEGAHSGEPYRLLMRRSSDGGATFSSPQDFGGGSADHDFPMIAAEGNRVYAAWIDDRDRLGKMNVWGRCSLDGGATWSPDERLSPPFDEYSGDYGGIAISPDGRVHLAWGADGAIWYGRGRCGARTSSSARR